LPNGKHAAIKVDGNARFCDLDPYLGAASVLAECCRNIVASGAEPVAFLDHCQFGDPNDGEIFWAFSRAVDGMADFAKAYPIPCVGGKVSFYNEDDETRKAVKSSPVVTVLGLIEKLEHVTKIGFTKKDEAIVLVGETKSELGGSEYLRTLGLYGDAPPTLNFELEIRTQRAVLDCIRHGLVTSCHDISKGGLGVAAAETSVAGELGATIDLAQLPGVKIRDEALLFSETNSRFILTSSKPTEILYAMQAANIPAAVVGTTGGGSLRFWGTGINCELDSLREAYLNSLQRILEPWQK
jgi:phosphoribosylformylglycinamidine synthase